MLFSLNVSVKNRHESGTFLVNETEYNCIQRNPPLQSPLLNGKADCYSGAGLSQPLLPGAEPASPRSGFPLGSGSPPACGAIHLGCSPLIHPDSAVAMATLAGQLLNLRQHKSLALRYPFASSATEGAVFMLMNSENLSSLTCPVHESCRFQPNKTCHRPGL